MGFPLAYAYLKSFEYLSQQNIRHQHNAEPHEQGIGSAPLTAVGVGFGDHFVADDVEHGATRKGESEGQNGRGKADGEIAEQGTDHLHQAGDHGGDKGLSR